MTASIDIVDVETGRIMKSKQFKSSNTGQTSATDSGPPEIDKAAIMEAAVANLANQFQKVIVPWTEIVEVEFKKAKDIPDLEIGIRQATVGDAQEAIQTFTTAAKAGEDSPGVKRSDIAAAYWNLGMIYTYTWQFDKATEALRKVDKYAAGDFDTVQARGTLERLRLERRKLEEHESTR